MAAGLLAGVVSGAPTTAAALAGRRPGPVAATREIGRRACGRPSFAAGAAVHLALSAAFALPVPPLARRRAGPLLGAGYGALLYALDFRLIAPRAWPEARRLDGPAQAADHLVYGLAAALAWRAIRPRR